MRCCHVGFEVGIKLTLCGEVSDWMSEIRSHSKNHAGDFT